MVRLLGRWRSARSRRPEAIFPTAVHRRADFRDPWRRRPAARAGLGIANFAAGAVGILSLLRPDFVLPSAIAAAIFYGLAGFRHAAQTKRNAKETFAIATDLFASVVLAAYSVFALLQ